MPNPIHPADPAKEKRIDPPFSSKLFLALALTFSLSAVMANHGAAASLEASADEHYRLAFSAMQNNDCAQMRRETIAAAHLGYDLDPRLLDEWGCRCGELLLPEEKGHWQFSALSISASGLLAAATLDGRVLIFNLLEPGEVSVWETGHPEITAIDLSDDGSLLAVGGGRRVLVRKVKAEQFIWAGNLDAHVSSLRFSPDGQRIAIGMNKLYAPVGESVQMSGFIRSMSLADTTDLVEMSMVPGNPADIAFSTDGKRLVAYCWSAKYSLNTFAWLGIWDAQTGVQELSRPLRTTSSFPAHISRDGRILAYAKLDRKVLARHRITLDDEGRPFDFANFASHGWLRNPANYHAVAYDVFQDTELPIINGPNVLALDPNGEHAVVLTESGEVKREHIGAGEVYNLNLTNISPQDQSRDFAVSFGPGSTLVIGRTEDDLARYGWLPSEISPPPQ